MCHPSFLVLAFASGLSNDSLWTFSSFLAQLLRPYGVSEIQAGWIGFSLTICGSLGSTLTGLLIDKHRSYKLPLLIGTLGASLCFSAVTLSLLYVSSPTVLYGLCFFLVTMMGTFLSALIPIQLEFAVEMTYPKPEGVTTAFLLCLGSILTPLLTVLGTNVIGDNPSQVNVIYFMIGCSALSAISALAQIFIRDNLKRFNKEIAIPAQKHESTLYGLEAERERFVMNDGSSEDEGIKEDSPALSQ